MGTSREQTLQIKGFRGVNRFKGGPTTEPTQFRKLQNYYAPTRDTLESIPGVSSKIGGGIPALSSIRHVNFLETNIGYDRKIVFYDHTMTSSAASYTPVISASNFFIVSGVPGGTKRFYCSFVGLGGESPLSNFVDVNCEDTIFTFTPPTWPDYLLNGWCGMNLYVEGNTSKMLVGTTWIGPGQTTPNPIIIHNSIVPGTVQPLYSATADGTINGASVTVYAGTLTDSDALQGGRTYYFAAAPYQELNSGNNRGRVAVNYTNTSSEILALYIPGDGPVEIDLDIGFTDTTIYGTVDSAWIFMGTTPEDLMLAPISAFEFPWSGGVPGYALGNRVSVPVPIDHTPAFIDRCRVRIKHMPTNHNNGVWTHGEDNGSGSNARKYFFYNCAQHYLRTGLLTDSSTSSLSSPDPTVSTPNFAGKTMACLALTEDEPVWTSGSLMNGYQIIPVKGAPYWNKSFNSGAEVVPSSGTALTASTYTSPFGLSAFRVSAGFDIVDFCNYANRSYYQNNFAVPFYTNGYVLRPIGKDFHTQTAPVGNSIIAFKNRLIIGLDESSFLGADGVVIYSEDGNPNSYTATPSATPAFNFVTAISFSEGDSLVGLGVYSNSAATAGPFHQLVIGKSASCWVWTGPGSAPQEISRGIGFASNKAFFNSNIGPGFVGRDNVYLIAGDSGTFPICNEFSDVLKAIPDVSTVSVAYHDQHIKVFYTDTDGVQKQIWCDIQTDDSGSPRKLWYGPHIMTPISGHAVAVEFDSIRDLHVGFSGSNLYRLSDPDVYTNNGSSIQRIIETQELSLETEHFKKILNGVYMASKITSQQEIFNIQAVFDKSYGGSSSVAMVQLNDGSYEWDGAGSAWDTATWSEEEKYAIYQRFFRNRTTGRILDVTINNTSSNNVKILDLSFLFGLSKRRLLR